MAKTKIALGARTEKTIRPRSPAAKQGIMYLHVKKAVITLSFIMFSSQAFAEDPALARLFSLRSLEGTMVMSSLNGEKTYIHNDTRAAKRFSPASTFKVLNTLIALEEKAAADKTDRLKWNGKIHDFAAWNQDHTLESAFKVSCVWCFQELARRVGAGEYRQYLEKLHYGKLTSPLNVTNFWLDGSLVINAIEQILFLKKVYRRTLPFSPASFETLREIMLVEQNQDYAVRAKTGWSMLTPATAWYVGFVETQNDTWFFALNFEVRDKKGLSARQQLMREAFQVKAIIK